MTCARDADLPEHLCGGLAVGFDEGGEFLRRVGFRDERRRLVERLHLRGCDRRRECGIELRHHRLRRFGRRECPKVALQAGIDAGFGERRQLGHEARALRPHRHQRLDRAGGDLRRRGAKAHVGDVDLAGVDRGVHLGGAALVRNRLDRDAGLGRDPAQIDVRQGCRAPGAPVDLAGIGLRVGDHLRVGVERRPGVRHQQVVGPRQPDHRRKAPLRIVRQIGKHLRIVGETVRHGDADGLPVRHCARAGRHAEHRARARPVLDDDRRAECLRQPLADDAGERIGRRRPPRRAR